VRPRPSVVSLALIVLALVHASWGFRALASGSLTVALSQLVAAGGLLLAGVAVGSRRTFGTAMGIAAAATSLRFFVGLSQPGPWLGPTAALVVGMGLAAYGARRLDGPGPVGITPLWLRGGFVLLAAGYAGFLALVTVNGARPLDQAELVLRIGAALAAAVFLDAPAAVFEGKGFGKDAPMRAQ